MTVYKPTIHSKVRYSQRVNYRETMDDTVRLAKLYGIKLKDIPNTEEYLDLRGFMGNHKIYYNKKIYIFSGCDYYKLITVYKTTDKRLLDLQQAKDKVRKESSKIGRKIRGAVISLNNFTYGIVFNNDKIMELHAKRSIADQYLKYKNLNHIIDISKKISLLLKGKIDNFVFKIDFSSCNENDEIIYKEIMKIPYGHTITYKQLVERLPFKTSPKVVSLAIKRCPICIIIPTHRVIKANGKIGNFSEDDRLKKILIDIEAKGYQKILNKENNEFQKQTKENKKNQCSKLNYSISNLDFFSDYIKKDIEE